MSEFKIKLKEKAKEKNIDLNEVMLDKFEKYMQLLIEWNEKMNLTAITEEDEIIEKHFIDSLSLVSSVKEKDKVADIGTGAGFPGIPLAIYFNSNIYLTLVDGLNKRLIFLEEVIKQLDLKNIKIKHSRAEELGRDNEYREKFDIICSRAVASLNVLLEYTIPLLKKDGKALIMKGSNVQEEITQAKNAMEKLNCKIKGINNYIIMGDNERSNIIIVKQQATSSIYPRHGSKVKKQPL